jgi:lipopolysaccharide export system protein LptA
MGCSLLAWAGESLEVTADKFTHMEQEHKAVFEGHARAVQGKSRIDAEKFIVLLDGNNSAREYQAIGNVRFEIVKPRQHVKGRCRRLYYRVEEETYRLKGNAKVEDLLNNRKMSGEEVFLDNRRRKASAVSERNKPVRFIFQMNDAEKKKK